MVCELCGSNDFTKDDDGLFVCDYCRTKYTPAQAQNMLVEGTVRVDRSDEVGKFLKIAEAALNHDNSGEAYDYANRALEIDPNNSRAWFIKGKAAGWSSSLLMPRHKEMIGAFSMAVENAPEEEAQEIKLDAAVELNEVATVVHRLSRAEAFGNPSVEEYWSAHIDRTDEAIALYFKSHEWSGHRQPLDNVISVASALFSGPSYIPPDPAPANSALGMMMEKAGEESRRITRSLSPSGQMYFRGKIEEAAEKIRVMDPDFVTPVPEAPRKKSSTCFVVTATTGNENSLSVRILRSFRDEILSHTQLGTRFISWYQTNGPTLAKAIEGSFALRILSMSVIVAPATLAAGSVLLIRAAVSQRPGASVWPTGTPLA
jgi:hypothetical protein